MIKIRKMRVFFFVFLLVVVPISAQQGFKPSITCYTKYNHEETKNQASNTLLAYSYHEAEITQYATTGGELCSKVGCACFSYRSVCSHSSPGVNHYSQCTDDDRHNGIIKWHRGWASHDQCEQMRRHSQTYLNLTCCYTDRCNDQPGKVTKLVDAQSRDQQLHPQPHQYYHSYSDSNRSPQQHHGHGHDPYTLQTVSPPLNQQRSSPRYNSQTYYSTTSRPVGTYRPNAVDDKFYSPLNSLSMNSYSHWMIFFALVFALFAIV